AFIKQLRENIPFFAEQLPQMPRLLYEVLELSREQKIRELEHHKHKRKNINSKRTWNKGLGMGIFSAMMMIGVFSSLEVLPNDKLATLAFSAAIIGGLISLINRKNRS
nr:ubiquinone biosynthesis regulatory protein kinase UbiB [Tatlockia sp.]